MGYRYETHLHTVQGSLCGRSTGAEQARFYKEMGYQGIIITDHFFGGNTTMPKEGKWKDRIDVFCKGYEDALAEGQKIGLDVFFGWEECFSRDDGRDEYLIYGLDKQWLYDHPEVEFWNRRQYFEAVHAAGGCMIQAHPFRKRDYIKEIRLGLKYCDGIEVANAGNDQWADVCAMRYAREFDLVTIAGSDNHLCTMHGLEGNRLLLGIELDEKFTDIQDFAKHVRSHGKISLVAPEERFVQDPENSPYYESFWLDEEEKLVPTERDWMKEGQKA